MTTISPAKVTVDELSLSWPAATDNRRVIGYRIWLNGYEVATTAETRATLRWFNDDEGQHVVQIKAIDAAGNQSAVWSTLLVTRPAPEPTETPTPTPTPTPTESPSVSPESQPTPSATWPGTRRPQPQPHRHRPVTSGPASAPGPLVVQSDRTLLLEIDHPAADACRIAIAPFAELERAPEHIHTYRLTPLGLWNARAAGHDAEQVVDTLLTYSRYPVPNACWWTSPRRWTATAGCGSRSIPPMGWSWSPPTARS